MFAVSPPGDGAIWWEDEPVMRFQGGGRWQWVGQEVKRIQTTSVSIPYHVLLSLESITLSGGDTGY